MAAAAAAAAANVFAGGGGDGGDGDGDGGAVLGARAGGGSRGKLGFSTKAVERRANGRGADTGVGATSAFAASTRGVDNAAAARDAAVRTIDIDGDGRSQAEAHAARVAAGQDLTDAATGEYKGVAGYVDRTAGFKREQGRAADKSTARGPQRAPANVRFHFRMDYQPDLCKDFKETGYCGYGDACIFLHDRGDYKAGWQIDAEWEEKQKKRREREAAGLDPDGDDDEGERKDKGDGLPFACAICREPFVDPIVTKCKHYFCEHCALRRYANDKTCAVCGKGTGGQFNVAHDIIRKRREIEREAKRQRTE